MSELIDKFSTVFAMTKEDWEHWREEINASERLLIAGPSRIVGLVDLTKFDDDDFDWTTYSLEGKPSNKMKGNFVYAGRVYSIDFLKKIVQFLGDTFEATRYQEAIFFKLSETIALGLAEKLVEEEFYYNDEGVFFVDFEWEKAQGLGTENEFIKWDGNVARRKHTGKLHSWFEEVWKHEQFFDEEEEMGDFLDL